MRYNRLSITAYDSTDAIMKAGLDKAQDILITTVYPAGLFAACEFYVPDIDVAAWELQLDQKIIVKNGLTTVWEGKVTGIQISYQGDQVGAAITCMGYWASVMMSRKWRKWWADTRISDDVFVWQIASSGAEKCTIDRHNRIRFTPKAVAWLNNEGASVRYTAPSGETVKRVTLNYTLAEGAQAWAIGLYNVTSAANVWAVTASGSGSRDDTFATPTQSFDLFFLAQANQTPAADGTIYGQITSIVVYTETGSINLTEVAKDIRAEISELSSSESLIASNTFSLVPFISEVDSFADILTKAAAYGDTSYNAWSCGIREGDLASDGKPVLFSEQQPALTDWDYAIRLDEENLVPPFTAEQDRTEICNWIAVLYRDVNGNLQVVTPDDDATLKDTASITAYGEIHKWIQVDTTSLTNAKNYGKRILAARKDPQWRVSSGITVVGHIRGKGKEIIPSSEIRAGKRIKVENFLNDLSGSGLTLLITATSYTDEGGINRLSVGRPDVLATWLARQG